jgi:hypothetical protein
VSRIDTLICIALVAFNANAFEVEILFAMHISLFQDLDIGLAKS